MLAAKMKLRVGVFMGGKSIEREVSFNSGRTICDHLDATIYDIIPIFQTHSGALYILPWHFLHRGKILDFYDRLDKEANKINWDDLKNIIDFVYIALHGRFGEDGTVQGFLEVLDIPYLGSKVFASSLGMNKIIQKIILKNHGINVSKYIVLNVENIEKLNSDNVLKIFEGTDVYFPCVVKPSHEGSSLGISVVYSEKELLNSIKKACNCDPTRKQEVLVEEQVEGMEFVCVCLEKDDKKWFELSVTQVITEKGATFFDYVQKYMPGRATKITPAKCSKEDYEKIVKTCIKVTQILDFSTISRIDGFLTKDGNVIIIDPNTLTGMGPSTFLFNQAAEAGMSHTQLINYLIKTEIKKYELINVSEDKNNMIKSNKQKIRIVVLLGGNTAEKEISLESGRNVCYKLSPYKYEVLPVFVNKKLELFKLNQKLLVQNSTDEISNLVTKDIKIKWSDLPNICDFVFIGLHGGKGENGSIQGTLQMLDLPYNGSGIFTSALCMDKYKTSCFLANHNFDVPKSILLDKNIWLNEKQKVENFVEKFLKEINFPLILKPHNDGCSFLVKKIYDKKEFLLELDKYFKVIDKVLIEELIKGVELTCGVFGNDKITVFPPSKVFAKEDILSVEEKFLPGAGQNLTPAPLSKKVLKFI